MLAEKETYILKAKAPRIKETIAKLKELSIELEICPLLEFL